VTRPGADSEAVLRELLGYTPEQIRELTGPAAGPSASA